MATMLVTSTVGVMRFKCSPSFTRASDALNFFALVFRFTRNCPFSEDIDLILDWRILGYAIKEPWEARSNKQQDIFNKGANAQAEQFLGEKLVPLLRHDFTHILGIDADISIDAQESQTINFNYLRIFDSTAITQAIRLEIGHLAAWTPTEVTRIVPYTISKRLYTKINRNAYGTSRTHLLGKGYYSSSRSTSSRKFCHAFSVFTTLL